MFHYQKIVIIIMLLVSLAILVLPGMFLLLGNAFRSRKGKPRRKSGVGAVLIFSACLVISLCTVRGAVGYYFMTKSGTETLSLKWWEELFGGVAHTIRSFTSDDGYKEYLTGGKAMLGEIFGQNTVWQDIYGLYASVLSILVTVVGGAIVFRVLSGIFPKIKLFFANLFFWKDKYYFNALNYSSLALCQSIYRSEKSLRRKPIFIFTNTAPDKKDEESAKLLSELKFMGAVCIKDDLAQVRKSRHAKRKFFLMNNCESDNMQNLVSLSDANNYTYLKDAEVYYFTNSDSYLQVERNIMDELSSERGFKAEELPVFVPVKNYRNLISNLLVEVPLYETLINKKKNKDGRWNLNVTIMGTGLIGTEMFLSTYWFGQILDCDLKINVISQESEALFWSKIDYVNPEIRHTTIEGDPILRYNRRGDMSEVYCQVSYYQCDINSSQFLDFLNDPESDILDTDYFLVSLGRDETNVSVANILRKYIGKAHIESNEANRTIINYVVYNDELTKVLNRNKCHSFISGSVDVYMQAVGSLSTMYSVRNVFMSEQDALARKSHEAYLTETDGEKLIKAHRERVSDDYKYWANLARGMHTKYRMFSMGLIRSSLFDHIGEEDVYAEEILRSYEEFKKILRGEFEFRDENHEKEHLELLHRMSWLEHRRWCAFTRIKGFRHTDNYDVYAKSGVGGSYKHTDIKLHPCLVECDKKGIRASMSSKGVVDETTLFRWDENTDLDFLDELSLALSKKKYNSGDLKIHDYPGRSF